MEIHGVVADLSMKIYYYYYSDISVYENCMTFLDNDSEIVLYQTLCVCKESKVSKHVQKYIFVVISIQGSSVE